ncbi:FlgM family anti-sigma-28 factor [Thermodesulfitimonas autotrophica]|jgi:negative regulator of flagellin synthesis FlgM|uniref:Negative regulator of flagellin synthesis n=1 Tax=Thermodesulfitimonas autotrophica TaxID=1894989 RepID=A0A3N5B094_9THEO|nr:flagellar biosynthesis anti-sigma factor FlgM [Thermodesulfitimonas autotrophica]RPF42888.1 FlgM family anti-sigma-28 factor [Thermodesulfitimonas autotrophica]
MKVGPTNNRTDVVRLYEIQQKKRQPEKAAKPDRPADSFEPSTAIQELQELQKRLQAIPDVREDLVAKLRQEIEAGTYKPDPQKIAAGIIEELRLDRRS